MNNYGKILLRLGQISVFVLASMSILVITAVTIKTGSDDCTNFEDVLNEKSCKTRGYPKYPGKCVSDIKLDGTSWFACRHEGDGSFPEQSDHNKFRGATDNDEENVNEKHHDENQSTPVDLLTYAFSQDINAPIFNLPIQRLLVPLSRGIIDCPWFISAAPYGKIDQKQVIRNINFDTDEIGSLVHVGYYGSYWFANTILALGATKTTVNVGDTISINQWHFGPIDGLFALGAKTNNDGDSLFAANGEVFFGVLSNRFVLGSIPNVLSGSVGLSAGVQGEIDWTFAKFNCAKFELSLFSRFAHFLKNSIEILNQKISYSSGSFVDVLLGLTQFYGSDYQHQIEVGYNPTIRVMNAEVENNQNNLFVNFDRVGMGKLYHTAYATYAYNWESNGLPMMLSLGGSATFTPYKKTYGTVFGTFGVSF